MDEFGPDRVVFGGDWPVCTLAATYRQWVVAPPGHRRQPAPAPRRKSCFMTTRSGSIDWPDRAKLSGLVEQRLHPVRSTHERSLHPGKAATEYRYEKLTWPEINDAVELGKVCILPCGAVEQHGPHLPLDVDVICPTEIARGRPDHP